VAISDTGERVPKEDLPYIFERFFREEEPRAKRTSETGLRLMIAKEIVELNRGWVTVESPSSTDALSAPERNKEGVGSTFTIWLPLVNSGELVNPAPEPGVTG
jgi:two-component system sensor histidine kinase ResE